MPKTFWEWWDGIGGVYANGFRNQKLAQAAWNAALDSAAEVADSATGESIQRLKTGEPNHEV